MMRINRIAMVLLVVFAASAMIAPETAGARPPYETDDPVPTDYRNYEIYTALQYERTAEAASASLPLFEINYGIFRNAQFSLDVPISFERESGSTAYGVGDLTFGLKMRFIQEAPHRPQVAFYPIAVVPSTQTALRRTSSRLFLPLRGLSGFRTFAAYAAYRIELSEEHR